MSRAYPLMRGLAPALVALFGVAFLGEHLAPAAWAGVALISCGVFGMTFAYRGPASRTGHPARAAQRRRHRHLHADRRHRRPPLRHARRLRHVALPAQRRPARRLGARSPAAAPFSPTPRRNWRLGLVGGLGNLGSYGLALWAMTGAPVATVAALRETSILFGMAIAGLVLHERIGPARLACAALIVAGAASLRLA